MKFEEDWEDLFDIKTQYHLLISTLLRLKMLF